VFTRDWIESETYAGPKQYLTGWAHHLAGRAARARIEWQAAAHLLEAARSNTPDRADYGFKHAEVLALLGDREGARKVLAESIELTGAAPETVDYETVDAWLLLGEEERVYAWLESFCREKSDFRWAFVHFRARYSPVWDSLRDRPEFERLLRETKPESAKPFD